MKYLHTMIRVTNLEDSINFFTSNLGMTETRRIESETGRFTLVFLAASEDLGNAKLNDSPVLELTWNWDPEEYDGGRNFGHLAYSVDDIYLTCQKLLDNGVTINRPPRDGKMAFIRSPDGISIELLQKGESLPKQEPWSSMDNIGVW
ncbi:MAG: VOC family protein [Pseudomonadota bacterium]|nr:VOC family protein [Pseudomonadota bacterium]